MKVLPVKTGPDRLDICTVNLPPDATPFQLAIELEDNCPQLHRIRFEVAKRDSVILADGRQTLPWVSGQFICADGGHLQRQTDQPAAGIAALTPADFIIPVRLTQDQCAAFTDEVVVHRLNRAPTRVTASTSLGPTDLLNRILFVLNAHGSGRLSFPAYMPEPATQATRCRPRWSSHSGAGNSLSRGLKASGNPSKRTLVCHHAATTLHPERCRGSARSSMPDQTATLSHLHQPCKSGTKSYWRPPPHSYHAAGQFCGCQP